MMYKMGKTNETAGWPCDGRGVKGCFAALIAVLLLASPAWGAAVTGEQAAKAAETFIVGRYAAVGQVAAETVTPSGRSRRRVHQMAELKNGTKVLGFIADLKPKGFVLLSADDEAPPVKLHAEDGGYANLPPEFLKVVQLELAEDLDALARKRQQKQPADAKYRNLWQALVNPAGAATSSTENTSAADTVLLTTAYDQGDPYNLYAPTASGGPGGRALAGCTACALAQILRYRSLPDVVLQNHSYSDNSGNSTGTYSLSDAELGAYDWASMPNSVGTSSPDAQKRATAQLMYHAAVALESNFEAGVTSAFPSAVPAVFRTYFGYTCGEYESKSGYTTTQWYGKISADVDASKPVFYAMWQANGTGGHAVVCDGYRNGNEIHLNLGWSGSGNAWYNVDSVSAGGYVWTIHGAVFGITPGEAFPEPVLSTEPAVTSGTSNTIYWSAVSGQVGLASGSAPAAQQSQASTLVSSTAPQGAAGTAVSAPAQGSFALSVQRTPETEQFFDHDDELSTGVMIMAPSALPLISTDVGTLEPQTGNSTSATEYFAMWNWSGSIAIPDTASWVGVNCFAPLNVPAGCVVTKVSVHHEIFHPYIGDLEVKVYNSNHTWLVRDNEGGSADNINETKTQTSLFTGDNAVQDWYYRVRDTAAFDVGTLTSVQIYVYYTLPLPDLSTYQPSQWTDKIPIGTTQLAASATHSFAGPYYDNQIFYINWSLINNGNASAGSSSVHLEITGTGGGTWDWTIASDAPGQYWWLGTDQGVGPLAAGTHTFRLWVDYSNTVSESNESNNYFERTIAVLPSAKPDLAPFQSANWDNPIPIGTTQLAASATHSFAGPYYDNQIFYINWSLINNGNASAGSSSVHLEITGTGGGTWDWTIASDAPGQYWWLGTDQGVGPLAAGTHTFRLWVDYSNTVSESNESNNYFERTINVTSAVVEYYSECANNASFALPISSGWTTALQWTFSDLTPGQTFWYRVKARKAGTETGWSNVEHSLQEPLAAISVTPSSQDFGSVPIGTTADRTFLVGNSGGGTLSGTASVSAPFSVVSGGTYSLGAGASQVVTVRFSPNSAGAQSSQVTFTGGGGVTRPVSGVGTKLMPVITWPNPADIIYGTALSATQLNATANPSGGAFAYTLVAGTLLNAGNGQTLSVAYTPQDTANYNTVTATVSINVLKKSLLVKADNKSKAYGQANPTLTATISGFLNGDSTSVVSGAPALSTTASTGSPVGTYPINAALGTLSAANYSFGFASGTLTVTKAILLVKADNKSKAYGQANPTLTATVSGLVNGDTATTMSGTPALTTSVTPASPAGAYPITVASGTLFSRDYDFDFIPGTLIVTQAELVIRADDKSRVVGQANPVLTAMFAGFVNGDTHASTVTGAPALSTTATPVSPVGTYPIAVSRGTLAAANYTFTFRDGSLAVTAYRPVLLVTADDKSRIYGRSNPVFTATITGLLNGDALAVVSGSPALSSTATPSSTVGTYRINAALGTLAAANYDFAFASGTLTVVKAAATVALTNLTQTYDGTAKAATASTTPPGLAVSLTYNGSPTPPANVGSYAVAATVNDANYQGSASGTLRIAAATSAPVITSGPSVISWLGPPTPEFFAAADQPVTWKWRFGDGLTGSGDTVAHTYLVAGPYTVTATATNAGGQSTSNTITVIIGGKLGESGTVGNDADTDGDGFSDEFEVVCH